MELRIITGHKTLQILARYTYLIAEDLVDRLKWLIMQRRPLEKIPSVFFDRNHYFHIFRLSNNCK